LAQEVPVLTDNTTKPRWPRVPTWILVLAVPVVAVVAVLATNPSWSAPVDPVAAGGAQVQIKDFAFTPVVVHASPGAKVVVLNADSTTHTMSASGGQFDTSNLAPGRRRTITAPTTPGRYRFVCKIHPNMIGTLVVGAS
jgi:plastocyanin